LKFYGRKYIKGEARIIGEERRECLLLRLFSFFYFITKKTHNNYGHPSPKKNKEKRDNNENDS
jgi:hypothetical protein